MQIAIIGSGGRLGRALVRCLQSNHQVLELTRDIIDLAEPASIRRVLYELEFDLLILTAALTAVDHCETHESEAFLINAEGPREVARICTKKGARLIHISTDFVFDGGKETPYTEVDRATPISVYGASKRKGEEYVLEASAENLVVRVSWLYGSKRPAFPEWIIQQALTHEFLALPGEKFGSPTSCEDLARYLESLLEQSADGAVSGIVHLCNSGSCNWQEWGQFCIDEASEAGLPLKARRISANRLEDVAAFIAQRPVNSVLDTSKYSKLTGIVPRSWQEAMKDHFLISPLVHANSK